MRSLPLKLQQDFNPGALAFKTPADIRNRSASFGKLMAMALMTWARTDDGHKAWGPLRSACALA